MVWTKSAWNNFKAQPEIWFFYGFLLTSMLSVRKVLWHIPLAGEFNEYTGIYLYLSDLFLLGALAAWLFSILYNKRLFLSNYITRPPLPSRRCSMWNIFRNNRETSYAILIPLALVAWSFISIKWSDNASITLYRSLKLFELYLLYLFLALNYLCSTPAKSISFLRNTFRIIIGITLINATIAIIQVLLQHSLGLFWLKESLISPNLPGVAKIVLGGTTYIRAYGLFPHPNILGGFLFLSILLTLVYRKLLHPSTNVPPQKESSTWNFLRGRRGTSYGAGVEQSAPHCAKECAEWRNGQCKMFSTSKSFFTTRICSTPASPASRHIFTLILVIQIVAGILTFSKSAILGLILALAYMFYPRKTVPPQKESSTWNFLRGKRGTSYGAGIEQTGFFWDRIFKKLLMAVMALGLIAYLLYPVYPDLYSVFVKSMAERLVYINISLAMISSNLLAGIGSGQFVLEMQRYSAEALLDWQFQPVHNVFLLIWSELGLVGFSFFTWFIWKIFQPGIDVPRLPRETKMFPVEHFSFLRGGTSGSTLGLKTVFKALLIGFFVIALFDHYLWDIQQGQIMLWMMLGLLVGTRPIS